MLKIQDIKCSPAFLYLVDARNAVAFAIDFCVLRTSAVGTGIVLPRYAAALVAFVLNYTAYFAEIFRGGLQSIDRGQYESARVLRLTYWQTIRKIIAPQVMKIVVPSIGNEVINLIKDSSLVYVIGLGDLLRAGNVASSRDVSLIPLVLVGIIYLALTAVFTWMLQKVEAVYGKWK